MIVRSSAAAVGFGLRGWLRVAAQETPQTKPVPLETAPLTGRSSLWRACSGKLARFCEFHAGESLNDRQRKIVNRLLNGFEGKLTSSKWAKLANCSQDTAHRDILDLVKRGILAKDEAGGRSTSYSLTNRADQLHDLLPDFR